MTRQNQNPKVFLDKALEELDRWNPELAARGLVLDFLFEHISNKDTANRLSSERAEEIYSHIKSDISKVVDKCLELGILKPDPDNETDDIIGTRLAEDDFAPILRHRFYDSQRPGQRARQILEHRAVEWVGTSKPKGKYAITRTFHEILAVVWKAINSGRGKVERVTLHATDLHHVEQGRDGMRDFRFEENNLLSASRTAVYIDRALLWVLPVSAVLYFAALYYVGNQKEEAERTRYATVVLSGANFMKEIDRPIVASLLVASLKDYEEPPNGVRVAHDIAQTAIPRDLYSHEGQFNSVACSVDGKQVLFGSENGAHIWHTDGKKPETLALEGFPVLEAVFNRNAKGPQIATVSTDNKIRVWDKKHLPGGEASWCSTVVGQHEHEILSLEFGQGGEQLLTTSSNKEEVELQEALNPESPLALKEELRVWDIDLISRPQEQCSEESQAGNLTEDSWPYEVSLKQASFSHRGGHYIVGIDPGSTKAKILSAIDFHQVGAPIEQKSEDGSQSVEVKQAMFSLDNRFVLLLHRNQPASLWEVDLKETDLTETNPPKSVETHFPELQAARFIDQNRLLTVSMDNEVTIWQLSDQAIDGENQQAPSINRLMEFVHKGERIEGIDFCLDSGNIVTAHARDSGSRTSEIRLWSENGAVEPVLLSGPSKRARANFESLLAGDDEFVTVNDRDVSVYLDGREAQAGPKVFKHSAKVFMATLNKKKSQLATASLDGFIRLFDVNAQADETGKIAPLRTYSVGRRESNPVINAAATSVDYSEDGTMLLGSSHEGKILIWVLDGKGEHKELDTGELVAKVEFKHAVDPSAQRIQTTSEDGSIRLWRYQWEDLVEALEPATLLCLTSEQRQDLLRRDQATADFEYQQCIDKKYEGMESALN